MGYIIILKPQKYMGLMTPIPHFIVENNGTLDPTTHIKSCFHPCCPKILDFLQPLSRSALAGSASTPPLISWCWCHPCRRRPQQFHGHPWAVPLWVYPPEIWQNWYPKFWSPVDIHFSKKKTVFKVSIRWNISRGVFFVEFPCEGCISFR